MSTHTHPFAINPLIQENGLVFGSSAELAQSLDALLGGFQQGKRQLLDRLRQGVEGMARWEENWVENAAPVLCDPALGRRRLAWWWILLLLAIGLGLGLAGVGWPMGFGGRRG